MTTWEHLLSFFPLLLAGCSHKRAFLELMQNIYRKGKGEEKILGFCHILLLAHAVMSGALRELMQNLHREEKQMNKQVFAIDLYVPHTPYVPSQ